VKAKRTQDFLVWLCSLFENLHVIVLAHYRGSSYQTTSKDATTTTMAEATKMDIDDKPTIKVNKRPSIPDESIQMPWVEKYRPAKLEDLVAHEDIVSILTKLIDSDNLPHLLLYGPPGTGKVSGRLPAALVCRILVHVMCTFFKSAHDTNTKYQFTHSMQQTLTLNHHLTDIDHSSRCQTNVRIHRSLQNHGP